MPPQTRSPSRKPARRRDSVVTPLRAVNRPRIVIKPESLQDFNDSCNWCIFGDSGVGKTVLAAFAPNAYILGTERGQISAKRAGSTAQLIRSPTWNHVEAGIEWADANLTNKHWLVVDSVSKMQQLLAMWWLGIQHEENEARDIDILQIQDHLKWQRMFMRFINHLVDAPYNVIFIATSMHREDAEGDPLVLPNIVGKDYTMANNFCADMDIVSCLRVAKRQNIDDPRQAIISNDTFPPYFGKDRYMALPRWEMLNDGEFDVIIDMIDDIMAVPSEVRQAAKAAER